MTASPWASSQLDDRDVVGRIAALRVTNEALLFHVPQRGVPAVLVEDGAVGVTQLLRYRPRTCCVSP